MYFRYRSSQISSAGTRHPGAHVWQHRKAQISYCLKNRMCSHRPDAADTDATAAVATQVLSHVPSRVLTLSDRFLSFTRALSSAAKNFAGCRLRLRPRSAAGRSHCGSPVGRGRKLRRRRQSRGVMPDRQTHFRSEEKGGAEVERNI